MALSVPIGQLRLGGAEGAPRPARSAWLPPVRVARAAHSSLVPVRRRAVR